MSEHHNIGEASKTTHLPIKTIRYYEDIGLIKPKRSSNGYRCYTATELHKLRFVQRARSLGFSIEDCKNLLSLYEDKDRTSAEVKLVAKGHLQEIEAKIQELENLREILSHLIEHCAGDERPQCPIIDSLSGTLQINENYDSKILS